MPFALQPGRGAQHVSEGRWYPIRSCMPSSESGNGAPCRRALSNHRMVRKDGLTTDGTAARQQLQPTQRSRTWPAISQLVICATLLSQRGEAAGTELHRVTEGLQSGVESLPGAYRSIPVAADGFPVNVFAATCLYGGKVPYQVLFAMVFGLTAAVFGRARWSAFLEATRRHNGSFMSSTSVDDGRLLGIEEADATGQ